jgi:hypothetical protein
MMFQKRNWRRYKVKTFQTEIENRSNASSAVEALRIEEYELANSGSGACSRLGMAPQYSPRDMVQLYFTQAGGRSEG